jgi:hypothetical protein
MMRHVGTRHFHIDDKPAMPEHWEPDRSFNGLTVVLVGGGPSFAAMDLTVLKGHRFIAINSSCRRVRPIATTDDMLYFTDNSWNENRPHYAAGWPGPVVTSNRHAKIRMGSAVRWIDMFKMTAEFGVRPDYLQASSGHIAAGLAAVMGAAKIVLIGFECQAVEGRTHGHDEYSQHDVGVYVERFLPGWRSLAGVFKRMGVEVINATPNSAVQEFPFLPLEQALA